MVRRGGGEKYVEREHRRGKLTARERIAALIDEGTDFTELGLFAGRGMYEDEGGCPAAGTVMGLGRIRGRLCLVVANDATVKAGAWFPRKTLPVPSTMRASSDMIGRYAPPATQEPMMAAI